MTALLLAAAIAGGAQLLPEMNKFVELAIALALIGLWIVLLPPLRAIPPQHWRPLIHMLRSFRRGTPANFRPRRGLRALEPAEREELRRAVVGRLPPERLAPEAGDEGLRLVRELRRVGKRGGIPVRESTEHDAEIALCLFEDSSTAVRNATMRRLLELGVDPNDLRSLEDLVAHLARVPDEGWEGRRSADGGRQLPGISHRRRAVRRRELRAAQPKR